MSPLSQFNEEAEAKKLGELRIKEQEDLAEVLSHKYKLPYTDLSIVPVNTGALTLIPEEISKEAQVAAFGLKGNSISVGILTPNNPNLEKALDILRRKKFVPELHLVSEESLKNAWKRYGEISHAEVSEQGVIDVNEKELALLTEKIKTVKDLHEVLEDATGKKDIRNISKILEIMIAGALSTDASDIHLEPEKEAVRFRLRLDGVLQNITNFDNHIYQLILSRIKIVSGLKLNIKKEAQDGRFSIRVGKNQIEIRTSLIPGSYAESVVLRILNPQSVSLDMASLGVDEKLLAVLLREIEKPHGMLLNTGPTGSGKTTTLYSFLKKINSPDIKIITIEDPVEYRLPGISQTQVREGYNFSDGLRSILRQDPDVIMVGEIRDGETAKIAVQASLTGHFVFSTLHTNTAAGAIPRLIDLGADEKVLGDALTVTMAQRLVRRLCQKCKEKYTASAEEAGLIKGIVMGMPKTYTEALPPLENIEIYKSVGCTLCNNTGFKGREGVYEVILMDDTVAQAVLTSPSERDVWKASHEQGLLRMGEHGILKVLAGITSLPEVGRVVDLKENL